MEDSRSKRTAETNREKQKKKNDQEKKTKSDTTAFGTGSAVTEPSSESIVVVGKGFNYGRSKTQESGCRLHECYSETAINLAPGTSNVMDIVRGEGLHPVPSNASFLSAKSEMSDAIHKRISELEDALHDQNMINHGLKKQLGRKQAVKVSSVSTETEISSSDIEAFKSRLKELEKKIVVKERKIKELNQKLEESAKVREAQGRENKSLTHQVNLLNRQLKSMFEMLGTKNWSSFGRRAGESDKLKSRTTELEALVRSMEEERGELSRKVEALSESLEAREKELALKCRELVEHKNKSTLEMCKLMSQMEELQKEARTQSEVLESKLVAAQNSMDDEIVSITQKLEEQYQEDMKSAMDKFQKDFERLSELPKAAIEKLVQYCEPEKVDLIGFQKEWEKQRSVLEAKIEAMRSDRSKEITQVKDSYETKVMFLKTQVEALSLQLKERKEIIDIFESELLEYKSNSSMNLLKASTLGDDISSLKELYNAELFSQKQVHKLQVDIFEEKVKTLTEEILYHAKNEEIHMQELENAKRMAFAFREKYEQLVFEWEERVERDLRQEPAGSETAMPELESMISEFKNLLETLKKSEEVHEQRIKVLETKNDEEKFSLLQDIENFKTKLKELKKFQKSQAQLDETIQDLIRTVGLSYTKTVEALLLSHVTELSLKQVELCSSEKRHIEEIDALKNEHEKELEELRRRVKALEESTRPGETDEEKKRKKEELDELRERAEELTVERMKLEGMMAAKEEAEEALSERIKALEDMMRSKEEDCREKLEELTAKYLKVEAISSAKDELVRELEEKVNEAEMLLEKSCGEVDRVAEVLVRRVKGTEGERKEEWDPNGCGDKSENVESGREAVRGKLLEAMGWIEALEKANAPAGDENTEEEEKLKKSLSLVAEENAVLNEEKTRILDENQKMKEEICRLVEKVKKTEKMLAELDSHEQELREKLMEVESERRKSLMREKQRKDEEENVSELKEKLEELEREKSEMAAREKQAKEEKLEVLERNGVLEGSVRDLSERVEMLMGLTGKKDSEEGVFSISLKEVRVLYEEERGAEVMQSASMSTTACQATLPGDEAQMSLWQTNEELKRENETLRSELQERESKLSVVFMEEMASKFKCIQQELSGVVDERDRLAEAAERLKEERERLRGEVESLRGGNATARAVKLEGSEEPEVAGLNRKIEKLSECVRSLTAKLNVMKASNEILISESQQHVRHNQSLVSELEEAWNQRYEIEDQLSKVRRENALLHLHRKQLEETNRRVSSLMADGRPSVVSWIRIHETVESIVDEVLSLKTSINDSGSAAPAALELTRTTSELKIMTDTLHAQLKNKTLLCDELILQKETLEKELKNLETGERFAGECSATRARRCRRHFNLKGRQHARKCCLEKRLASDWGEGGGSSGPGPGSFHLTTLTRLKRSLVDQAEREKAKFHENLKLDIRDLGKEMAKGDECEEECLKAIEARYEEEVTELTKEFEAEVEKLKAAFGVEEGGEGFRDDHAEEIERLKAYFEGRWKDLEERYAAACIAQTAKKPGSTPEKNGILEELEGILREEGGEEERKRKVESLLKGMLSVHEEEVRSLREKYEEAVALVEEKHVSEVQKLQAVVLELKESISVALRGGGEGGDGGEEERGDLLGSIREEYEARLEEEKKRLWDSLEEAKRKHETEISALEEFWTEKLSECETRCAIMKATRTPKRGSRGECEEGGGEGESRTEGTAPEADQSCSERSGAEERRIVKYRGEERGSGAWGHPSGPRNTVEDGLRVSRLRKLSIFGEMEVKTDDDKLDVMLQRDRLQETVDSLRGMIARLLAVMGQQQGDSSFDVDETLYRSIHMDLDRTLSAEASVVSNGALASMDLSSALQEMRENSVLNSSDQVRFELERCLQQLKKDATCLLALSCPENAGKSLGELLQKVEKEKEALEAKVTRVEEMQREMRKEITMTKDRLSQWERNLEVVSEGYGEAIVEPKQTIPPSDLKDRLKQYLSEHCAQSLDFNLLDEICKEGDRLQEEWKKEKDDLQQQIEVADKQVHSLKKFLEEQAYEREQEREAFDREVAGLRESLRARERDSSLQNRTNREVEALEGQLKELATRLSETEKNKAAVEGEFQNAVKKIWSLREVIQDLEVQLAEVSERESHLKKKLERAEAAMEEQSQASKCFKEELEALKHENELKCTEHVKGLEEELIRLRHAAEQIHPDNLTALRASLRQIEGVLIKKTKDLEQLHVSSANVSCSSPSEDVSLRDHLDATRCSTPDEMCASAQPANITLPTDEVDRIHEKLARHTRAEEVALKYIRDLKMQLRSHRKALEEVQTERDVLLEKVDMYLKENSGLKVRLEEQRCNAGLLQKQLNANLESQISRLEVDVENLNGLCNEKDKQLRDLREMLENTTKSLKVRETEALNKSKEENALITTLRTDLANALNENSQLEERLEKATEKLRESLKMPALIDSMLEEKNAEIDRLEKEVARLSCSKAVSTPRSYRTDEKHKRRIRFSEPESFSGNISSISVQCPSDLRNCSENSADLRSSSFKIRRPVGCSTKLESVSSIAPLQLSPRGGDYSFGWKASSPVVRAETPVKSPAKTCPSPPELGQMEEVSRLEGEVESKQRQIAELHLEIDKLKRQLVEGKEEADKARAERKEAENELVTKEEEIRKLRNNEKSLQMTVETLKASHAEEVEELESKLSFEHGKVEKVYEEIKALEVKKIEIEESFLSLREDYNEKINAERRTGEALVERIRTLEAKNEESEGKLAALEREAEAKGKEMGKTIETLLKEIVHLRSENEKARSGSGGGVEVGTQSEGAECVCRGALRLEGETSEGSGVALREDIDELKVEFDKMSAAIGERDFNKKEAFSYAMAVRRLFSVVLAKVDELSKELESHVKKVMECSVDELAVRVQKELVLSARLDNQLLSSIEANGFGSKEATPQPEPSEVAGNPAEVGGGGDCQFVVPKALGKAPVGKAVGMREDMREKVWELEGEKRTLEEKVKELERVVAVLEGSLRQEKERILEEKERCCEDAKIMELLRVNLEKSLSDMRAKEKELKKEKQQRMAVEREMESLKKHGSRGWEGKKVMELNAQLESQKEKLVSIGKLLEEERKKNQELGLSLEESKIERMSEKKAVRLLEGDLALLREQKQNFKGELIKAKKLLHARDVEIGLLKRRINLQEIDIKALSISNNQRNPSDASTVSNGDTVLDLCAGSESPASMLFRMRKLNSCVRKHVKESSEMDEALLYLSEGAEEMKDIIRKLEESSETKLTEETLIPDVEVERKLWALEKGRLVMDLETLKRENEVLKHDLIDTCKSNDILKLENSKMKREAREVVNKSKTPKENAPGQFDTLLQQKRVSHLTRKYLRAESHRKALAWQKNYLTLAVKEYERSEEALRKVGRKKREEREAKRKPRTAGRFRVVALAVVAIFRMRYIVRRWKKSPSHEVFSLLDPHTLKLKIPPCGPPALDVYNEPVNPLSYQTQNICRQSSSHVLRTPPSRDPGPQSFFLSSKHIRDSLETYDYFQDTNDIRSHN